MPLDATQRDFIIQTLGVQPKRRTKNRSAPEQQDSRIRAALNDYLGRESKALATLGELRKVPGADKLAEEVEGEIRAAQNAVKSAQRDNAPEEIRAAFENLAATQTKARELADSANANKEFYAKLDTARKDLEALQKHPQRAHVKTEIDAATAAIGTAETESRALKYTEAGVAVTTAADACKDGKGFADKFGEVMVMKADAMRAVGAINARLNATAAQNNVNAVQAGAQKANYPARNYVDAKKDLKKIADQFQLAIKTDYVDKAEANIKPAIDKRTELDAYLLVRPGKTVIQDDITRIEALQQQVAADYNAARWGEAVMTARKLIPGQVITAVKIGDRRLKYDQQRVATVAEIDKLKSRKSLLGQIASMRNLLTRADSLATRAAMRMEDGIAELKNIDATCKQLVAVADDAEGYLTERTRADNGLAGLRQSQSRQGREAIAPQLASIETVLAQATKATGVINAESTIKVGLNMEDHFSGAQDWGDARKLVAQAQTDIDAANALAGNLEDTVAAKASIDKAGDLPKIEAAVDALRKQAEAAKGKPHADLADHEFTHIFLSLDEALDQAKAGHFDIAKIPLEGAADLLITAKTVQTEHARFEAAYKLIDDRQKALNALTDPPASQLTGKIAPIGTALTEAARQDTARDWGKAQAALRTADAAAKEAEEIRDLRKTFNDKATALENRNSALTNPLKGSVTAMIAKARGEADKFDLNFATRYLENAEAQIEGDTVAKLATNPDDPQFLAAIKKMLAARGGAELAIKPTYDPNNPAKQEVDPVKAKQARELPGGAELLDAVVAKLGDGGSAAESSKITRAIAIIARERFGVDLAVSVLQSAGPGKFAEVVPTQGVGPNAPKTKGAEITLVEPVNPAAGARRPQTARKIYDMMARVPEQSEKNPSMKRFERTDAYKAQNDGTINPGEGTSGGFYRSSDDFVSMSGRAQFGSKQKFGAPLNQVAKDVFGGDTKMLPPPVDPVYAPVDEADIDYFDFASVHEVGHAVDDRMGFMKSREEAAAFGGWKTYGGAVEPIAKAVAGDAAGKNPGADAAAVKQFVTDLLTGAKPDKPAVEPDKQSATDLACDAATAWYTIATNEKVWWNQNQSAQVAIDGIVYQEAYKGTWVSYPLAERAKGITGYQFRAPGEWFAELYAAYHMGKLKTGHPARRWLSSLSL